MLFPQVCINNTCHPISVLGSKCDSKANCNGHGVSATGVLGWGGGRAGGFTAHLYTLPWASQVCNNKGTCHCYSGWQPPDCSRRGSRWGRPRLAQGGECGQLPGWRGQGWQCPVPSWAGVLPGLQRVLDDGEKAWLVLGSSFVLLALSAALGLGLWRQQVLGQRRRERPPGTDR